MKSETEVDIAVGEVRLTGQSVRLDSNFDWSILRKRGKDPAVTWFFLYSD
jgi:hypothetical protein